MSESSDARPSGEEEQPMRAITDELATSLVEQGEKFKTKDEGNSYPDWVVTTLTDNCLSIKHTGDNISINLIQREIGQFPPYKLYKRDNGCDVGEELSREFWGTESNASFIAEFRNFDEAFRSVLAFIVGYQESKKRTTVASQQETQSDV